LILIFTFNILHAAARDSLFLHQDSLNKSIDLDGACLYHAGDDSTWAAAQVDVAVWDTLTPEMAICFLKIRGNQLFASGVGVPPLLICRGSTNNLEEIIFQGMPLGSLANFPYEERQLYLFPGDKINLMSDGFPERLDAAGKMLDYPQAYQSILAAAVGSPQEVVQHLVKKGNDWAKGHPQEDDVTFVVIEVK
jgi:hypothetical protein